MKKRVWKVSQRSKAWLKKYYPKAACGNVSLLVALQHEERKIEGLLPKNLKRYGLTILDDCVHEEKQNGVPVLVLDGTTSCLCMKYGDLMGCGDEDCCGECPFGFCDPDDDDDLWFSCYFSHNYEPWLKAVRLLIKKHTKKS